MNNEKRVISLAALGGMLELYDFAVYGFFSVYFAKQFFPANNAYMTILETYMVFFLGFILRPIGGILFSHIGDEFGRKRVLVYTIFIMGMSSVGIACLPTYAEIGVASPLLLLFCRLVQGLALGGELPTTYVYISESLPQKKAIAFGFVMAGIFCGYLLASLTNYVLTHVFTLTELGSYVWRIPFAIGGVICFISYKVRKSLRETPAFEAIMNKPKLPIVYLLKNYWDKVILGVIFSATQQVFSIVAIIYGPTYLHVILHMQMSVISAVLPCAIMLTIIMIIASGFICNRYHNVHKLLLLALFTNVVAVPLCYYLFSINVNIFVCYGLLMIAHGFIALLIPLYLTMLFPTNIRLSGVALSYNISVASFGGLAPIIITTLIKQTGMMFITPVIYIMVFIFLSFIGVVSIQKRIAKEPA